MTDTKERQREYNKRYAKSPKGRAAHRRWLKNNPEKVRANGRAKAKRHRESGRRKDWEDANRERLNEKSRRYYEENPARRQEAIKRWECKNPEKVRQRHRNAQARRRAASRAGENLKVEEVLRRSDGLCGICETPVDPSDFHIDHIIPLARGGAHSYANTQAAHPLCNQRKGAAC